MKCKEILSAITCLELIEKRKIHKMGFWFNRFRIKNENERRIIIEKLNHEAAFEARFDVFQYIEERGKKSLYILIIDLWSAGMSEENSSRGVQKNFRQ